MSICKATNCTIDAKKGGFCNRHYLINWRHGSPNPIGLVEKIVGVSTLERFMHYVFPMPKEIGCWMWTGSTNKQGYGQIRFGGKLRLSTHVSLDLFSNGLPDGMCALHKCDTPLCVNPDHLFVGTQKDNMKDMSSKGRANGGSRKMTIEQVKTIRSSKQTQTSIASEYGLTQSAVSRILNNKTWSESKCSFA